LTTVPALAQRSGTIQRFASNLCLQPVNESTALGAARRGHHSSVVLATQIYVCNGTLAQIWSIP
jgi:hypothetical protein